MFINHQKTSGYQMKTKYNAEELMVAKLKWFSKDESEFGPQPKITEIEYLFENVIEDGKTKYKEVFTGYCFEDHMQYFNLPWVVDPTPLTKRNPELTGHIFSNISLLLIQNDINHLKELEDNKRYQKS